MPQSINLVVRRRSTVARLEPREFSADWLRLVSDQGRTAGEIAKLPAYNESQFRIQHARPIAVCWVGKKGIDPHLAFQMRTSLSRRRAGCTCTTCDGGASLAAKRSIRVALSCTRTTDISSFAAPESAPAACQRRGLTRLTLNESYANHFMLAPR
jgi:hypothetical protein